MRRVFYYALGGGLGHVTRSLAAIHTLPIGGAVRMAVSTRRAAMIETPAHVELIGPPAGLSPSDRRSVADWIAAASSEFAPDEWFVDCFPAGVLGELTIDPGLPKTLVSRRVEWGAYLRRAPGIADWPRFSQSYAAERLSPRQTRDLETIGPRPELMTLRDFCGPGTRRRIDSLVRSLGPQSRKKSRLVVHSGPAAETERILARALEDGDSRQPILLVTPAAVCPERLPSNVIPCSVFPAWPLFSHMERIYTAGGANSMRQLESFRDRHIAVPLERPLDDQKRRLTEREDALDGDISKRPEDRAGRRREKAGNQRRKQLNPIGSAR